MSERKSRHLSVVHGGNQSGVAPLTRAEVADRLGVSISTVRRYEGDRLHPTQGADSVRRFDPAEVAVLAAELIADPRTKRRNAAAPRAKPVPRSDGEIAAEVFERLEQRQSLAEIVIGVRVTPDRVHALYDQWRLGLIEQHLERGKSNAPPLGDYVRDTPSGLGARLHALPSGAHRISVGRYRGPYSVTTDNGDTHDVALVTELGGFHVAGPSTLHEITRRFGGGSYRITAYQMDPPGLLWEILVEGVTPATQT